MVRLVKGKNQDQAKIQDFTNSKLIKHVINGLFTIIKRRTSDSFSVMILTDIMKTLENKFRFLKYIRINKIEYIEEDYNAVTISVNLDDINSREIGRAIESIIRVVSANMKDKNAGLFFITELKNQIDNQYIPHLQKIGVDIDLIQVEQHYLYKHGRRKGAVLDSKNKIQLKEKKKTEYASLLNFTWDKVAFWEYKDNICTIYDKKGKVLDRLPLDKIVKDYIVEMVGFDKLPLNSEKLVELSEKEYEFIKLLFSKDMDAEEAMHLLHISRDELSIIIRKLFVYEILQYISYDMVMLTETGVDALIK